MKKVLQTDTESRLNANVVKADVAPESLRSSVLQSRFDYFDYLLWKAGLSCRFHGMVYHRREEG